MNDRRVIMKIILKHTVQVNYANNSQTINITAIHKKSFDK